MCEAVECAFRCTTVDDFRHLPLMYALTNYSKNVSTDPMQLGSILLVVNLVCFVLVAYWGIEIEAAERDRRAWRRNCALSEREAQLVNEVMAGMCKPIGEEFEHGKPEEAAGPCKLAAVSSSRAAAAHRQEKELEILEQHLLPAKSVKLEQRIGTGAFGEVFKGLLHGIPCAVKTMKKPVSEAAVVSFRKEILITSQLRHPNVVEFKGACWGGDLTALILGWCSSEFQCFCLRFSGWC